jgi:hypothetical protein
MPLVVKDRVRETSTTAGTGTFTLAGAVTGYQAFSAVGNGNTTYYTIYLQGGNEWEVGIGTYTASGTTLSRDTVLASSAGGAKVSFSAGVKDVFVTYPADRSVWYDSATNVTIDALTVSNNTILGDASTDTVQVNGYMGVGVSPTSNTKVRVSGTTTGATTQIGVYSNVISSSGATNELSGFRSLVNTAAASFTVANVHGMSVFDPVRGAGSTITNLHGLYIADQTQGTNNFGITSLVSSGTNKWNIYASGTAANYFAGNVGIGTSSPDSYNVLGGTIAAVAGSGVSNLSIVSGASSTGNILFADGTSGDERRAGRIAYDHSLNNLYFFTNGNSLKATIDSSGNLGIGTSSPLALMHASAPLAAGTIVNVGMFSQTSGSNPTVGQGARITLAANSSTTRCAAIEGVHESGTNAHYLAFLTSANGTNPAERLRIDSSGASIFKPAAGTGAVFNEDGVDADFRVESDTNTHALFVDAGNSYVGINTSSPINALSVAGSINRSAAYDGALDMVGYTVPAIGTVLTNQPRIILLAVTGTAAGRVVNGTFYGMRSTASAATRTARYRVAVSVNSSGTVTGASLVTEGLTPGGQNELVTCSYAGNTWIALYIAGVTSSNYPGGYYFSGISTTPADLGTIDAASVTSIATYTTASGEFSASNAATFTVTTGDTVFNESGGDYDFRVESDTNTHAFFLEGSSGNVGIGTSSPGTTTATYPSSWQPAFQVYGATNAVGIIRSGTGEARLNLVSGGAGVNEKNWFIGAISTGALTFSSGLDTLGGTERLRLSQSEAVFNDPGNDYDFRVESDTDTHAFFVQGSDGFVGIGTSIPARKFHVSRDNSSSIVGLFESANAEAAITLKGSGTTNDIQVRLAANGNNLVAYAGGAERARITSAGNVSIGGTADRATTVGTKALNIFNGTAPVGTLTNGISIYSSAGEAYVMDAAGNATLFSPHDKETNEWIFRSKHTPTGKVLKIDVERLLKFVNDHFGLDAVHEFIED